MRIPWRSERSSKIRFLKLIKKEAKKKKRPIFESYKKVCGKIGSEAIDYLEFEYFYMAFYQNPEFKSENYDGSGKPNFSDLPLEIIFKVLGELDPIQRCIVRQVSKSLRLMIDAQKPEKWYYISLREDLNGVKIELKKLLADEEHEIRFTKKKGGCTVVCGKNEIYFKGADHLTLAFNILAPILSQEDWELGHSLKLTLENDPKIFDKFVKFIDFLVRKLAPRKLNLFDLLIETKFEIPVANFFSNINATFLSNLQIKPPSYELKIGNYEEILETEVFKKAGAVSLAFCEALDSVLIDKFFHLELFQCHLDKCSMEELLRLREKLSSLENFVDCYIRLESPLDLNEVAATWDVEIQDNGSIFHDFGIANSEFHLHFEFNFTRIFVHVEKRKNEQ